MEICMPLSPSQFSDADSETLAEILRQAESQLAAQLSIAIAQDQRATSFISLIAASVAVLLGGAASLLLAKNLLIVAWIAAATGIGLLVSMLFATMAVQPVKFWMTGSAPNQWLADIGEKKTLAQSLAEQAALYDEKIEANHSKLDRHGALMHKALWTAWVSLALGGGAAFIAMAVHALT
jgi:hypothetical protein